MHGRKRQPARAMTPEEQGQIDSYVKHKNMALAAHLKKLVNPATLTLTSKLLSINPDFYTLFNYRKEQVMTLLAAPDADVYKIWSDELELSALALKKQPKSYYAWYHRQWVVVHGKAYVNLVDELKLTEMFLDRDLRNFHCWNYRRFLALTCMGISPDTDTSPAEIANEAAHADILAKSSIPFTPEHICASPESELLHTTIRIASDLSNFSAWYTRSQYLPLVCLRVLFGITCPEQALYASTITNSTSSANSTPMKDKRITTFYTPDQPYMPLSSSPVYNTTTTTTTTTSIEKSFANTFPFTSKFTAVEGLIMYMKLLQQEFEILRLATTMSPNDQSPWIYFRWVLGQLVHIEEFPILAGFLGTSRITPNFASLLKVSTTTFLETPNVYWEHFIKRHPELALVYNVLRVSIVLQQVEYIVDELYLLEPQSSQILVILLLLKYALHKLQTSATGTTTSTSNTSTVPSLHELMNQLQSVQVTLTNETFFLPSSSSSSSSSSVSISDMEGVYTALLAKVQQYSDKIGAIDCINKLKQYDPLRIGFYEAFEKQVPGITNTNK